MPDQENFEVDLDLLDADSVQEIVEIDPDANPLEEPNPVEDGLHRCKVLLNTAAGAIQSKSWTDKKTGVEHPFISVKFSLSVIDEGVDQNKRIFPNAINTNVFDGKCEMAHLLIQILGGDSSAKETVRGIGGNYIALAKAFKAALVAEPIVKVQTKWIAQYKDGSKDKKGRDAYKTALSGMRNFKKRADGTFDPTIAVKGNEARARATVTAYFPDGQ